MVAGSIVSLCNDVDGERLWIEGGHLVVPRLRQIHQQFRNIAIIWGSATTRPERAKLLFPGIEIIEPPQPIAPHQRVHLITGAWGKQAFKRTPSKIADLDAFIRLAMLGKQSGLVVAHQDIEPAFAGIAGVKTLHHGSVAGDDDFGNIDAEFVIGGPFAPPGGTRDIAQAEAQCRIPYAKPVKTPCAVLTGDGVGVGFERFAYADPRLQSVHAGIYDSGVIQAMGRARGINRTANNPVDIYVFANLPVPVTSIERYRPVSRLDRMFLAGHVPTNAVHFDGVIPEIDIWRAAQLMLKRYGERALEESAARADELAHAGDDDGAVTWRRIMAVVTHLANKTPPGPMH